VRALEAPQARRQPVVDRVALRREAYHRARAARPAPDLLFHPAQLLEHAARRAQQALARGREHEPPADPLEQLDAQALLGVAELVAERRLRQVQAQPRARHAAFLGDRLHQQQVSDLQQGHVCEYLSRSE
jgi:hypothetical protein